MLNNSFMQEIVEHNFSLISMLKEKRDIDNRNRYLSSFKHSMKIGIVSVYMILTSMLAVVVGLLIMMMIMLISIFAILISFLVGPVVGLMHIFFSSVF